MFINRAKNGRNNLCGTEIARLRIEQGLSQRMLADQMQLLGLDIDKNAVQRIESGQRFVTDIELSLFAARFGISADKLLGAEESETH